MPRILIVDDDECFRTVLRETLERAGYEVLEAEDGETGLKLHHRERPDLVITDIVMPGKAGLELIAEIRRDFPGTRIIAMSGGGQANPYSYLNMARENGAESIFLKPIDREAFLAKVRDMVGEPDSPETVTT
jgi:DNA-binding response OmpR family regulator